MGSVWGRDQRFWISAKAPASNDPDCLRAVI